MIPWPMDLPRRAGIHVHVSIAIRLYLGTMQPSPCESEHSASVPSYGELRSLESRNSRVPCPLHAVMSLMHRGDAKMRLLVRRHIGMEA